MSTQNLSALATLGPQQLRRLRQIANRYLQNRADSADAVSEGIVSVLARIQRGEDVPIAPEVFPAYLAKTVCHKSLSGLRYRRRKYVGATNHCWDGECSPDHSQTPLDSLLVDENLHALKQAMIDLTPAEQELLEMSIGRSYLGPRSANSSAAPSEQ